MEKLDFICDNLDDIHTVDSIFSYYKNNYTQIIHNVDPEELNKRLDRQDENYTVLLALYVGALFVRRNFTEICSAITDVDLTGSDRRMDYFVAKLVKHYFSGLKHTSREIEIIYRLLATNREYGNNETVGVLTNCILSLEIGIGVFEPLKIVRPMTSCNENAKYYFYHGVAEMVLGNYTSALRYFAEADVQQQNKQIALAVQKNNIVCGLLAGNFAMRYRYVEELEPYFALVGSVKRAELGTFYAVLDKYKSEYFSMNLWFVVRRLVKNLLREGVRKISTCYTRIPLNEISRILGTDARLLLEEALESNFITGHVEDGVYYAGCLRDRVDLSYSAAIREIVGVEEAIQKMMRYPEIFPLSYEQLL